MFKVILRILKYSKPYKLSLIGAVIFSFIGVLLSLFVPVLIGKGVDVMIGKGKVDLAKLFQICLILALTVVTSSSFQWFSSLATNRLSYNTIRDIRKDYFLKLGIVPLKFIDKNTRGELISRAVNDIETVSDGLLQGFTQLFSGLVTIIGTLVFMMTVNVRIALIVMILTPLSLFTAAIITKLSHDSFVKQSEMRGRMSSFTEEMIGNQKVVKAFCYEDRAMEEFSKINKALKKSGIRSVFFSSMTNPTTRFVNGIIYAAVGTAGAFSAVGAAGFLGVMTKGQLSSFLLYSNQYTKPFNEISGVVTELQNAAACAERVFSVIDSEPEPSDENKPVLKAADGTVSIKDLSFSYQPDKPLIHDFSLDVKRSGQKIAIVGPTGCGKTTIINLLLRFYDADSGTISISDTDIKTVTRDSLRSCFGMVLQDTWLFAGTIAENIAYGKENATIEEITDAAKAAHAHSFIKRLPNGYDTIIDEEGGGLSQGQKQLISIARIMLTDPPMLILDEATSNIDIRTEQRIQRAFEKLMNGRTSFVIAHRLSTIKNADMILVMRDGNIIEQGDHYDLIAQNGFYKKLYMSQFE